VADLGAERAEDATVEAVTGVDVVAEKRADPLAAGADVRLRGRPAAVPDRREAPAGVAGKEAHQVEDVRAEDHQVFAAAAGGFLAAASQLDQLPALAVPQ